MESKEQCLVFGFIFTHEKETFVKVDFSAFSLSIVGAVCRATVTTKETKTLVTFGLAVLS